MTTSLRLSKVHEASVKCVTAMQSNPDVVVTGGREGRIVVHDIRQNKQSMQLGAPIPEGEVLSWRNASNQ